MDQQQLEELKSKIKCRNTIDTDDIDIDDIEMDDVLHPEEQVEETKSENENENEKKPENLETISVKSNEEELEPDDPKTQHIFWNHFVEFSSNTTIHGTRYLGEPNRPWSEKIFWLIAMPLCITTLSYFLYGIWAKWDKSPIIIGIADAPTPVYDIPFPAITFCPDTKNTSGYDDSFNSIFNQYLSRDKIPQSKITERDQLKFDADSNICDYYNIEQINKSRWRGRKYLNLSHVAAINETALITEHIFLLCEWSENLAIPCEDLFERVLTEDGVCYTFNVVKEMLNSQKLVKDYEFLMSSNPARHWNFNNQYKTNGDLLTSYPFRTAFYGEHYGFKVHLLSKAEYLDPFCSTVDEGFKISIHAPHDYPRISRDYKVLKRDDQSHVRIYPKIMSASDDLRKYSVSKRQCYFNDEKPLDFFKIYTQSNCQLECLIKSTYAQCGCVGYSMVHPPEYPICGPELMDCYQRAIVNEYDLHERFLKHETDLDKCGCLPNCNSISYTTEIIDRVYNISRNFQAQPNMSLTQYQLNNYTITTVIFYFTEKQYEGKKYLEMYGIIDFVSNFGGLLGLFMGASIISLVELLFFYTLRLANNMIFDL